MVQSLKVILWDEEVGRLAWDAKRRLSYFMYNPAFVKKGLNIAPLVAPVDGARGLTESIGIANLSSVQLKAMVEKYFRLKQTA